MIEDYLNDPEFIELRQAYLDDLRAKAPEILTAVEKADFTAARSFGHNLKGNGTSYGFQRISELGADIERAAINEKRDVLMERLPQLIEYLAEVKL